jgi:hypothetical protein
MVMMLMASVLVLAVRRPAHHLEHWHPARSHEAVDQADGE